MNIINLTIELGPETQKKLDQILEALQQASKHNCHKCVENAVAMTKNLAEAAAATPTPEPDEAPAPLNPDVVMNHPVDEVSPHAEPAPEPERAVAQFTQADILAVVQRLIAPGSKKREKAKAIVNDYATKISAIPADKYNEVMARLIELEREKEA